MRRRCSRSAPSNTPISAVGSQRAQLPRFGSGRDEEPAATFAQQPAHDALDAEAVSIGLDDRGSSPRAPRGRGASRKLRASASRSMRNVAGRGESRSSPAQSTYGGRSTLTSAAGPPSATSRYAPTCAGTSADSPRSSVPSISPSVRRTSTRPASACSVCGVDARDIDGQQRRRLEMLEPEVLRVDGPPHAGAHELRLDHELRGLSRRQVQRFERRVDVDVAQRETHVVPRPKRRCQAGESRARTRRALPGCRARAPRQRWVCRLRPPPAAGSRCK